MFTTSFVWGYHVSTVVLGQYYNLAYRLLWAPYYTG